MCRMRKITREILVCLFAVLISQQVAFGLDLNGTDAESYPVVKTVNGPVKGVRRSFLNLTVDEFLGIPFAKPPLGDLRFKKPVPNGPWAGVLDARNLSNSCQQERSESFPGFRGEEMWNPNTPVSEDCLYLNLWVPKGCTNASVLVWIYGGGYYSGTSTLDVYDGKVLAATTGVIVASMNYRVGPFGFLYTGNEDAPGNVGFYDQVLAIQWIKDNIQFFGGNPDSLTLFGESAGAGSVSFLLMSPVSSNLTRRAILQSGAANAPWSYFSADSAKNMTMNLINNVGCNNASLTPSNFSSAIECLRAVDAKALSAAQWLYQPVMGFSVGPTIDGTFIPKDPHVMLEEGSFPPAEVIMGTNLDEGTYFLLYGFLQYFDKDKSTNLTREQYLEIIDTFFKSSSKVEREAIAFQYTEWNPAAQNGDKESVWNTKNVKEIFADYLINCPVNFMAQKLAEHGSSVYSYYFTQRSTSNPWGQWMGVLHGDEIEYVFGHPLKPSLNFTRAEQNLSCRIMNYFTTFAKTGKPVIDGPIAWPRYTRKEPLQFVLHGEFHGIVQEDRYKNCALWNNFLPTIQNTCRI